MSPQSWLQSKQGKQIPIPALWKALGKPSNVSVQKYQQGMQCFLSDQQDSWWPREYNANKYPWEN